MHSVCNYAGPQHFCHIAACSAWVPVTVLDRSGREEEPSPPALPWPRRASVSPLYSVTTVTARVSAASIVYRHSRRSASWENGSLGHLTVTVNSQQNRGFEVPQSLASRPAALCIVRGTWPRPRVSQPDPPGLIHDDPRLLPPWRGSSFFVVRLVNGSHCSPTSPRLSTDS